MIHEMVYSEEHNAGSIIPVSERTETAQLSQPRLFDLLIRDDPQLDTIVVEDESESGQLQQVQTIQRLLAVSVTGTVLYGAVVGLAAQFLTVQGPMATWLGSLPLLTVPVALSSAFLMALVVCLPSFYFYTQLSGLDVSFRLITAQALRVQARTAVLLLGALPVYAAFVLATIVFESKGGADSVIYGLLIPFIVGLAGLGSLYRSFERLSETLPVAHARRPWFLSRMVIAWGAVYTAVCPVALYRIGAALAM